REEVAAHNVIGTLPGASAEWMIIASHHDAPWASAVEDGSGIAMVLAQATHWASVPAEERPHNLLFLLTTGHMVHGAGTRSFIDAHQDLLGDVVLEIHLEHTASEVRGDGHGGLEPTGEPEVRWWFTTQEPELEASVQSALEAEDLRRSLVLRPDIFGPYPTTDGGFFHGEGVPLVNFLTAPMYLFDSADTIDKIHVDSLEPVGRAVVRIVESLRGRTAANLRAVSR
ncbi:MAG TPA: M28 family peptidase, partial [Acidimicrobiales bacterium]|nr:M28 family peptidase [Acidimicrobiales bacterium]